MSKKTKKEKIISDYRKRMQLLKLEEHSAGVQLVEPVKSETPVVRKASAHTEPVFRTKLTSLEREGLMQQAMLISRDLKKTLALSVVGIGILVGLYFFAPL